MRKGNVEELKVATRERIEMIVLRRDFSKQIIDKVKLKNSVISKSLFNEASIYGNEYENCEFVSCDFSNAKLFAIKFINCRFHETKFDDASLENIEFIDCKVINCTFKNVDFSLNVSGLSEKDKNVILESDENIDLVELTKLGFEKTEDFCYKIISDDGLAELVMVKDDEYGPYIWRAMLMAKDESLLSDTIDIEDDVDLGRISREIKGVIYDAKRSLNTGKYNDFISEDEKESIDNAIKNIISKFKQFFSEDEI